MIWIGQAVIVRASGAGCHFGYVTHMEKDTVTLERSRRLWRYWSAKNGSLSAVATDGIDVEKSNIGDAITVTIFGVHEIIAVTPRAIASIEAGKWTR
jgi:hypothetical protein